MTTITAETVLRSRNKAAPTKVLTTLLLRYPAFMHQDFMTHRVFSRNAMSTRAVPMKKMLRMILTDMAMPIHWGKNQGGMQAREELIGFRRWLARTLWRTAGYMACLLAGLLYLVGVHKQVGNMILWPFMHFTTVVSSTEWDNFLELRDHEDARPEIQALARAIRACLEREDDIQVLEPGHWHLPFVTRPLGGLGAISRHDMFVDDRLATIGEKRKLATARGGQDVRGHRHGREGPPLPRV